MPLPRPLSTCVATVLLLTLAPALPAAAQVPPPATVPPPAEVLAGGWGSGPAREVAINAADITAAAGRTWLVEPARDVLTREDARGTSLLRVVEPDGTTRVVATADTSCDASCPASFTGVAAADDGTVYVSDRVRGQVLRWDGDQRFTVVAGDAGGQQALDGVPARAAALNLGRYGRPDLLEVDTAGALVLVTMITPFAGGRVWRIASDGRLQHLAGGGIEYSGRGNDQVATQVDLQVADLAYDAAGHLLIAEQHWVRRLDDDGVLRRVVGQDAPGASGDGGDAASAGLSGALSIDVTPAGDLLIAGGSLRRVAAATGTISTVLGGGTTGVVDGGSSSVWVYPQSVAALGEDALVLAGEFYEPRILRRPADRAVVEYFAGNGGTTFSGDGRQATTAQLKEAGHVVELPDGALLVHDAGHGRVRRVGADGVITAFAGGGTEMPAEGLRATEVFSLALGGVAVDDEGVVYLSYPGLRQVWSVDPRSGRLHLVAGNGGWLPSGDGGPATTAALDQPGALMVIGSDLFVTDGSLVRVVDLVTGMIQALPLIRDGSLALDGDLHGSLVVLTETGRVRRLSRCGGAAQLWTVPSGEAEADDLAALPDGRIAIVRAGRLELLRDGRAVPVPGAPGNLATIAVLADGSLAGSTQDGRHVVSLAAPAAAPAQPDPCADDEPADARLWAVADAPYCDGTDAVTDVVAGDDAGRPTIFSVAVAGDHGRGAGITIHDREPGRLRVVLADRGLRVGDDVDLDVHAAWDSRPVLRASGTVPDCTRQLFDDVPLDRYFSTPVSWAVAQGVTLGTTPSTFSPSRVVDRGQAVTFLWRAAGEPDATTAAGFVDVPGSAYYARAVAWAREEGITGGTTPTTFSPAAPLTRAQAVALLWRSAGEPQAAGGGGFVDVDPRAYYAQAVAWAAEAEVTRGRTATSFAPQDRVTRAEMVTFLYRYLH